MTTYERVERVITFIDSRREEQPDLDALAKVAGLSPFHFHRLFTRWAGVTPKAFVKFVTSQNAKNLLLTKDLLSASYDAGLSGPGRLHDLFVTVDGVTPGEYKSRGDGVVIRWGFHETPFGRALVATTPRGLCHLDFSSSRGAALARLKKKWPKAVLREDHAGTASVVAKAFSGRKLALHLRGTPFQLKVWEALLRIPAGRAATYAQVAKAVGRPKASRAVGAAVGSNALAVVIPCHRVLRATGAFGGYRWGVLRKRALLAREAAR
ncbi:MAG: methylated-DNA--[protein]-cysteine S-methyltransferase [Elusimicrobiota bacterium]|nr:methylated-DNA--[protein]-cysteine S-methyltransferase [Elusimicrobiota bacterium]